MQFLGEKSYFLNFDIFIKVLASSFIGNKMVATDNFRTEFFLSELKNIPDLDVLGQKKRIIFFRINFFRMKFFHLFLIKKVKLRNIFQFCGKAVLIWNYSHLGCLLTTLNGIKLKNSSFSGMCSSIENRNFHDFQPILMNKKTKMISVTSTLWFCLNKILWTCLYGRFELKYLQKRFKYTENWKSLSHWLQ